MFTYIHIYIYIRIYVNNHIYIHLPTYAKKRLPCFTCDHQQGLTIEVAQLGQVIRSKVHICTVLSENSQDAHVAWLQFQSEFLNV